MNDFSELNEHAAKLTRQIGLIGTGLGIEEINEKVEAVEREIGELRDDNNRLTRENEELKGSLESLISSVENIRLSELPGSFQGVDKKLDAILEMGRANDVSAEAKTTEHVGVVAVGTVGIEKRTIRPAEGSLYCHAPTRWPSSRMTASVASSSSPSLEIQ